jgi:hypothetical protein
MGMALADDLADATGTFLASLDDHLRQLATQPFDDERRTWTYLPGERSGVPLHQLDRRQAKAVHRLLSVLTPPAVHARVETIMALDEVLDRHERYSSGRRHRGDYWCAVYGAPGSDRWSVRLEGHHVSVRATVVDGKVRCTPLFLGANPAVVHDHGCVVSAPLGPEEELGFELLHALSDEQRSAAIVADDAPDDITTRDLPRIGEPPTDGVPLDAVSGVAATVADALLAVHLDRVVDGAGRLDPAGATFAWAGAHEPGTGHYYRVAAPRLLVELDNTQDGANHVHTVLRDPRSDFGDDLLAGHYRASHG